MSETTTAQPKADAAPRYATGTEELCSRVMAARERSGRKAVADYLGWSESAVWRAERNKVHPSELAHLRAKASGLLSIDATLPVSKYRAARQLVADTEDLNTIRRQLLDLLA